MAIVHNMTESWTPFESSIIKTDTDVEAEIDYSCILNTHRELDRRDDVFHSPSSTEGLFSDNIPTEVNERAHINIIEMYEQASNEYRAFFTYENLFSKFVILRPLKKVPDSDSSVPEIAEKLIDIFSLFGAPKILESSNGRSFAEKLVRELRKRIPALEMVHGNILNQNYSRRDFKMFIESWQKANPSKLWHEGLHFIQIRENTSNFSSNQSESLYNSPAEIFFQRNLANDLIRFRSINDSIETVDEIWTEEERLEKTIENNSPVPSPKSSNKSIDCNDNQKNVASSNLTNSVLNEILCETEEGSTDAIKFHVPTKEIFNCFICDRIFGRKCHLKNHLRSHRTTLENGEKYEGSTNGHTKARMVNNEKENSGDVRNEINSDGIKPKRRSSRILLSFKKNTINLCKSSSKLKNNVKSHKDGNDRITSTQTPYYRYECDICKKKITTKCNLKRHILIHNGQKSHRCNICENIYTSAHTLKRHISVVHHSEKIFKCEICGKAFKQISDLTRHKKIHNDERPFQCQICEKRFKLKNSLNIHLVIHSDSKSFECDLCQRTFNRKRNLRNHIISGHANIRPFECYTCKTTFTRNHTLQRHIISIHANIRPFKCDICKITFPRKHTLQRHILCVHANLRPFKCKICKTTFNNKQNLQRHVVLVHTIECPYFCCICDKKFKRIDNLNVHMTSH